MSATGDTPVLAVAVTNWPNPDRDAKPINSVYVTTLRTYVIDPAATTIDGGRRVQISDYEPNRVRMTIRPIDAAVAVTLEQPTASPDSGVATVAPQGLYLPANVNGPAEPFYGPDAMWLNSLTTATRVSVIKEYSR